MGRLEGESGEHQAEEGASRSAGQTSSSVVRGGGGISASSSGGASWLTIGAYSARNVSSLHHENTLKRTC